MKCIHGKEFHDFPKCFEEHDWVNNDEQYIVLNEFIDALARMYRQYCGGKTGHEFMGAGENAQEILEKYGLLKNANEMGGNGIVETHYEHFINSMMQNGK